MKVAAVCVNQSIERRYACPDVARIFRVWMELEIINSENDNVPEAEQAEKGQRKQHPDN